MPIASRSRQRDVQPVMRRNELFARFSFADFRSRTPGRRTPGGLRVEASQVAEFIAINSLHLTLACLQTDPDFAAPADRGDAYR